MAEFFPSNILDNVLKQLDFPIFQNNKLNPLQRSQFRHLRSKLDLFKCVIDDAEAMAVLVPDIVGKWVRDLTNVLYEIDDLLDEVVTRSMPSSGMLEKVGMRLYRLPLDLTVAPKVKRFNKRLESIVKECHRCNLLVQPASSGSSNVGGGTKKLVARRGIVRYHPDCMKDGGEWHMIGRDDDKKEVIKMLFNEDATDDPVVWITGRVGVGKTTLCSAVYNDEEVENHFDSRQWVDFLQAVLDSIERQKIDSLIERKEKTLIVLDGTPVFRSGYIGESWGRLKNLVATSHNGSKILVTSRHPYGGSFKEDNCHSLYTNQLSDKHCRAIFENTAFIQSTHDKKQWKKDLGKVIADKCCKTPSLLRVIGTLLYQNDDESLWDYFSHRFDFDSQYKHYLKISQVSQSFPKREQALDYLKLFIKDGFTFTTLIHQNAALGFTNFSSEMKPELRGYFSHWKEKKEDGWDDTFKIDPRKEHIITWMGGSEAIFLGSLMDLGHGEEARHVAIDRPSSSSTQQRRIRLPPGLISDATHKIRSLLFPKELSPVRMSVETLDMLTSKFQNLRVLDLHDLALKGLPSSFGNLIHLRYLDLSCNEFRQLPKSICRLKNLQTLKLVYCDKLVKLPQCIKSLSHLKHLELSMCWDLTHMPATIAEMTSLERLDRFVVGPYNGGLRYLKNLNRLGGHLRIELPQQWKKPAAKSAEDAEQANFKGKDGLTSVQFKWNGAYSGDDRIGSNDVLDKLEPSTSINSLSIANFGGTQFPTWITTFGMEGRLTNITISHCRGCKILPPFHKMPKLESLSLTFMNIEYLQDENNQRRNAALFDVPSAHDTMLFPSLSRLEIGRMPKLIGWSRDMSGLLRFSDIWNVEIWDCPHLIAMPPFYNSGIILQNVSKKMLQAIDWKERRRLEIISIPEMASLPDEFVSKLPSDLTVKDCDGWQEFWVNDDKQTPTTLRSLSEGFQRLEYLSIENCPAMKYMSSSLRLLTNLRGLKICKCSQELDCLYKVDEDGMPWKALKDLQSLMIKGFEKLVTLPKALQHLLELHTLRIENCKSLISCFHFSELNEAEVCPIEENGETKMLFDTSVHSSRVFRWGLKDLSIVNCPEMKYGSSSLRHLVDLWTLEISKCSEELDCLYKEEEDGMPWKALRELYSLKIKGFENLVALPKGLQHLRSLRRLQIRDCKTLEGGGGAGPAETGRTLHQIMPLLL